MFDFEYLFVGIILFIISVFFINLYLDVSDKWCRFLIFLYYIIFVLLIVEHIIYIRIENKEIEIDQNNLVSGENRALVLQRNLVTRHPIFNSCSKIMFLQLALSSSNYI